MSAGSQLRPNQPGDAMDVEWVPIPAVIDVRGDKIVIFHDDRGRPHPRRVAEVVLETFVGPCPPGHELRFKDENRLNCEQSNLEWFNAIPVGHKLVSGPVALRPARVDVEGRITSEGGESVLMTGLEQDQVLQSLADLKAGRVRPLRNIQAERRG